MVQRPPPWQVPVPPPAAAPPAAVPGALQLVALQPEALRLGAVPLEPATHAVAATADPTAAAQAAAEPSGSSKAASNMDALYLGSQKKVRFHPDVVSPPGTRGGGMVPTTAKAPAPVLAPKGGGKGPVGSQGAGGGGQAKWWPAWHAGLFGT